MTGSEADIERMFNHKTVCFDVTSRRFENFPSPGLEPLPQIQKGREEREGGPTVTFLLTHPDAVT